jgi:hypothetical protein
MRGNMEMYVSSTVVDEVSSSGNIELLKIGPHGHQCQPPAKKALPVKPATILDLRRRCHRIFRAALQRYFCGSIRNSRRAAHRSARLGTTAEERSNIGATTHALMLNVMGVFGLKRILEREVETWDGRSALAHNPLWKVAHGCCRTGLQLRM